MTSLPCSMRVLVAAGESSAGQAIADWLMQSGWAADLAGSASAARSALAAKRYAATVLDHGGLGDGGGADLVACCSDLPGRPPALVLCTPTEVHQLVDGDTRPHEYALKPAQPELVAARLWALVHGAQGNLDACLSAGGMVLDPQARVVYRSGVAMQLPVREFDLLSLLMSRAGEVVTRAQAAGHLYQWGQEIRSNAVDVHIHSLRRRFGRTLIRTVRGQGHMLAG